jgi:tight adherence protein C
MMVRFLERNFPRKSSRKDAGSTAQMLAQAGYRHRRAVAIYRATQISSAAGLAIIGFAAAAAVGEGARMGLLWSLGAGYMGAAIPTFWVTRRARMRTRLITHELSDVLDLMIVCVEAGLGIHESIALVGRECARHGREIGAELMTVSREIGSGASFGEALRRLSDRLGIEELKPLAATMIQSEQLGAQVAPSLRANSDALRAKRRLKAEASAQKATVKILFPLVIFVLPAMLLVIVGPSLIHIVKTIKG